MCSAPTKIKEIRRTEVLGKVGSVATLGKVAEAAILPFFDRVIDPGTTVASVITPRLTVTYKNKRQMDRYMKLKKGIISFLFKMSTDILLSTDSHCCHIIYLQNIFFSSKI